MSRIKPFEKAQHELRHYPPSFRARIASYGLQADWRALALECRDRVERELCPDPVLDYEPRRKRNAASHGTPTSTSTGSGRVELPADSDPLKSIPARVYLPVLTGVEVSSNGRTRCPMADHADEHPSAKAYGVRWHCFGCNRGGSIFDAAAEAYGLSTSGLDFIELRWRLLGEFGLAEEVRR
jgi:hypothetical protein